MNESSAPDGARYGIVRTFYQLEHERTLTVTMVRKGVEQGSGVVEGRETNEADEGEVSRAEERKAAGGSSAV